MNIVKRPYLGDLEMAVLEYIWPRERVDAKNVHMALEPTRGMSLNTIQSTLERLFKKKLLSREKISHAYFYQAAIKREELMGRMIDNVVKTLSGGDAEGMLAAFVDIAARDDNAHLDRLEQLIADYRRTRAQEDT
ncbi:MAG: BlaI/MecI/CopY family transcriptional regulator [Pseudomonadota bacterium]